MKVLFACLADYAKADRQGKLDITGVFDRIQTKGFPARVAQMFLVFRLLFEFDDHGKPHRAAMLLVDQDGKEHAKLKGEFGTIERVPPGRFAAVNQIFQINDIIFPKAGRFKFVIRADDEEVDVPFEVVGPGSGK